MKILKLIFTISLFLLFTNIIYSQTEQDQKPKPSLNNGTIESQFDYLYRKSSSYQEYKVVKKTFFVKIKGNVLDSLKNLKKELANTKIVVVSQGDEINNLKNDLKTTNDNLTNVTKEKDNIKFIGIPLTKASYNSILWSVIAILIVLLLFFVYKFNASNSITKQSNELLTETEEDFESYKAVALEREQKVRRELQDELNKQKYNTKKGKKE
ncbi:MAG: tRNA (guanine-N1)-methyltransferase [Flavobacteriaceae bacterium]|nr:tRNA (guanine-N1)-methyltransferase [Flavobacteriaceae bacterium]